MRRKVGRELIFDFEDKSGNSHSAKEYGDVSLGLQGVQGHTVKLSGDDECITGPHSDTLFTYYQGDSTGTFNMANSNANDGNWHHYLVTYDSSTDLMKVYLEGIKKGEFYAGTISSSCTYPMSIGCFDATGSVRKMNWSTPGILSRMDFQLILLMRLLITTLL